MWGRDLDPSWVPHGVPYNPEGLTVLGAPIGSPLYIGATVDKKLENRGYRLMDSLRELGHRQSSYQLLRLCARPIPTYWARLLPPSCEPDRQALLRFDAPLLSAC